MTPNLLVVGIIFSSSHSSIFLVEFIYVNVQIAKCICHKGSGTTKRETSIACSIVKVLQFLQLHHFWVSDLCSSYHLYYMIYECKLTRRITSMDLEYLRVSPFGIGRSVWCFRGTYSSLVTTYSWGQKGLQKCLKKASREWYSLFWCLPIAH